MPKHNTYEQDENISDNDIVLGSDAEDNLKTKNFRIGKLKDYFLSFVETIVVNPRPYKVYTALLTQSGTNAPVATVLENTLGVTPTFIYDEVGNYRIALNGGFTEEKTWQVIQSDAPTAKIIYADGSDNLRIDVVAGDNNLYFQPIEIRVYN